MFQDFTDNRIVHDEVDHLHLSLTVRTDKQVNLPNFLDTLGWILYKQKNYNKSLEHLKKGAELSPKNPEIHDHLGEVYQAMGKTKEAKNQWQKAYKLTKDDALKKKIKEKIKDNKKNSRD